VLYSADTDNACYKPFNLVMMMQEQLKRVIRMNKEKHKFSQYCNIQTFSLYSMKWLV